jgi:hypothetical protein
LSLSMRHSDCSYIWLPHLPHARYVPHPFHFPWLNNQNGYVVKSSS